MVCLAMSLKCEFKYLWIILRKMSIQTQQKFNTKVENSVWQPVSNVAEIRLLITISWKIVQKFVTKLK